MSENVVKLSEKLNLPLCCFLVHQRSHGPQLTASQVPTINIIDCIWDVISALKVYKGKASRETTFVPWYNDLIDRCKLIDESFNLCIRCGIADILKIDASGEHALCIA